MNDGRAQYGDFVESRFPVAPERSIMSVDVEEYYNRIPSAETLVDELGMPKRAHVTLPRLLDLLDEHSVHATFFVLASIVENIEPLLGRIVDGGHEIACHGWSHKPVHQMTPEEFRDDTARSRDRIEAATGARPLGFRAAAFSMSGATTWAFDILRDEGFEYDSSVAALKNFHYGGLADAPPWPHRLTNGLVEFPLPVYRFGPLRTLVGGGFYLRVFPLWLNRYFLWRYTRRTGCPPVIYVHPWEFDDPKYNAWNYAPDHPAQRQHARFMKWANTCNRRGALKKLRRLIRSRQWTHFREVLGA